MKYIERYIIFADGKIAWGCPGCGKYNKSKYESGECCRCQFCGKDFLIQEEGDD